MAPPLVRFPSNPITPHGAYHVLHDRIPQMGLTSYDGSVAFNMMGGLAIPDFINAPGRVEVKDIKGLVPPWRSITQQGATQDGVSFVDALYGAMEVDLSLRVKGKDPADCRRVGRYLFDSIDAKKTSRLWWFTHHLGYWWADVRWRQNSDDPIGGIRNKTQELTLRLQADSGFWQSYPCVEDFAFGYETASDDFHAADDPDDLGTNWEIAYYGGGSGIVHRADNQATSTLSGGKGAICRRIGYTAGSDNTVTKVLIGALKGPLWSSSVALDIWTRMNNTGTPGTSGIRLRIKQFNMTLSYFVGGVETVMRVRDIKIPPRGGEAFKLVCGIEGDVRYFQVQRNNATIMTVKENPGVSPLGAGNRSAGMGFQAFGSEQTPNVNKWSIGDNNKVTQETFLRRVNVGDQPMYDNYIVYGPGDFKFWNGPNAGVNEYVSFGTLKDNQVMYLRTDPRKRGVVDMTSIPPSPQALTQFQKALRDFLSFATGNNATPLASEIESLFGIKAPQGNPYSLLKGRWNNAAAIPPKSPGKAAQEYKVRVSIDNGNSNSKIIATGIPLRRMPY